MHRLVTESDSQRSERGKHTLLRHQKTHSATNLPISEVHRAFCDRSLPKSRSIIQRIGLAITRPRVDAFGPESDVARQALSEIDPRPSR